MSESPTRQDRFTHARRVAAEWIAAHPLAFWAMVFLAVRLALLLANDGYLFDADLPQKAIHFQEEFNNTDLARELARGNWALLDGIALAPGSIFGGEYVQVLLYLAVMKVLGQSYYVVKLVPLGFSLAIFLLLLLVARQVLGDRGVHVFGALAVPAFPNWLYGGYYGLGNHVELALFLAAAFAVLAFLLTRRVLTRRTLPLFLALGAILGAGLFYNLLTLPFLLWIVPFALAALVKFLRGRPALALAGAGLLVVGFVIGLSPLLALRAATRVPTAFDLTLLGSIPDGTEMGLTGYQKYPLTENMEFLSLGLRQEIDGPAFAAYLADDVPRMFGFADAANLAYTLLLIALAVLFLVSLFSRRAPPGYRLIAIMAFSYVLTHIVAVGAAGGVFGGPDRDPFTGYRYLFPLYPFLGLWTALTLGFWIGSPRAIIRRLSVAALALFVGFGLLGYAQHFSPLSLGKYRRLDGFSYEALTNSVWDYFREYPGGPGEACAQAHLYLEDCDPAWKRVVDEHLARLCRQPATIEPNPVPLTAPIMDELP